MPSWQTTVVPEFAGTTTVVFAGGGGLLLLIQPESIAAATTAADKVFMDFSPHFPRRQCRNGKASLDTGEGPKALWA